MGWAEIVMFAIQGAIQLYGAGRRAYVDGTRERTLVLPLPRTQGVDWTSASVFFTHTSRGNQILKTRPELAEIIDSDNVDDRAALLDLYISLHGDVFPSWGPGKNERGLDRAQQLSALLRVRQWEAGEMGAPPTPLQQIGGTLINIAVDYFADTPGAVSTTRPAGKALLSFLQAIEKVDFAEVPPTVIVPHLMVAMLDAVADNTALVGGGAKEQLLVKGIAQCMAESANIYLPNATTLELEDAGSWLGMATRALVKGGADTVLANPVLFLGIHEGAESNVMSQVGKSIADLLVGEARLTFRRLLSCEGLTTVVRSSLEAVAKNPELLKVGNEGLKNILLAIAKNVADKESVLGPDLFPELAQLILQQSAENIDLLWGSSYTSADKHLLITASGQVLGALATPASVAATWTPRLSRDQILKIANLIFDEVIDNPNWLLQHAGATVPTLRVALDAMIDSLRKLDGARISADAGVAILLSGIKAVALQLTLLDNMPPSGGDAGKMVLTAALDVIFAVIFDDALTAAAQWRLARGSFVTAAVEIGLTELARAGAKPAQVDVLRLAVRDLADGTTPNLDHFVIDLHDRLKIPVAIGA